MSTDRDERSRAGEGLHLMESLKKLLGPSAVIGGLGAAMFCGAGLANADTGDDGGSSPRASNSRAATADTDAPARQPRGSATPARVGSAAASTGQLTTPRARVVTTATVQIRGNESPASAAPRPAAATKPAPAAASAAPAAASAAPAAASAPAVVQAPAPAAAKAPSVPVTPSTVPVDPAQFAGTYYEQASVKQFFSIGLVNTKAVYTARPDGTIGVQNSGNYFFNRGPRSSITGSAVPVNPINTALNVGFGGRPSSNPPGNYLIVDRAPDYSWVIVSDPSGRGGFVLTRSQTIDAQTYQELVAKARALGVKGRITPTKQFPA